MKTHLKYGSTMAAVLFTAGMLSCDLNKIQYSEDDSESVQSEAVSAAYFEDAADLSSTAISSPSATIGGRRKLLVNDVRLLCADVTLDIDSGSTRTFPIGTITIDFGTGCADKRGAIRSGKIRIAYSGKRFLPSSTITTTFDNYTINGVAMSGTYMISDTPASTEDHPIFSIAVTGGSLTFPNGKTATRESQITREWIRTVDGASDKWIVGGQATGTNRNRKQYVITVSDSLHYFKSCEILNTKFLPSEGKETLIVGNKRIDIDFGDGACDQRVTISIKGKSTTSDLKEIL